MTSTPVKDIGNTMKTFMQTAGFQGQTAKTGFQEVLNNQTGREGSRDTSVQEKTSAQDKISAREKETVAGESLKAKEARREQLAKSSDAGDSEELTQEELEKAMEALGSAAVQLMEEIAELFGISVEELQEIMEELDMQSLDVLNPDKLSGLLLEAGDADSLSLLTNAELYDNYRTVMERLNMVLQQSGEALNMDMEQLAQLLEDASKLNAADDASESVIPVEVTVEDTVTEEEPSAAEGKGEQANVPNEVQNAAAKRQTSDGSEQHTGNDNGQNGYLIFVNI